MSRLFALLRDWWLGRQGAGAGDDVGAPAFGRGRLGGVLPTLDLHGVGVREAIEQVEEFLRASRHLGVRRVRIVYGKGRHSRGGRGILREVVPRWLETEGARYVARWERRLDASGLDGGAEVVLRPASPQQREESET
ncbi:MAG: Smr/MutS family protein [Candidatus Tectomicrobia bacterium]|nr:Smr/MutS family protein [Candidatus Tectomicrobia bacterium]